MENKFEVPSQVTIDFSCLNNNQISADLYILLFCKYHKCKAPKIITDYWFDDNIALNHLQDNQFIKITGENEFELKQKAIDLFKSSDSNKNWLEFLGKFPAKVPAQNGGTRALKISNPDSKGNINIKKKYIALIKNKPNLHNQIIKVLEAELKMRRESSNLQYMHNMDTWLNQADYDKYMYLINEDSLPNENKVSSYGQTII